MQHRRVRDARAIGLQIIFLLGLWMTSAVDAQVVRPFAMTWSDTTYGPDGPWQAVQVGIGSNDNKIALYPGGSWQSTILLADICTNSSLSPVCYATAAGVFDPSSSNTWNNESVQLAPNGVWGSYNFGYSDAVPLNALAKRALETIDIGGIMVPSSDIVGIHQGYQTYPGGQHYPLEVGILSLGASDPNQTFSETTGPPINGTFVTSWAWTVGKAGSYSYGMHIGSAPLGIPGSLYLGGYDKNRIVGDVTAQPYSGGSFPIQLLDLSLGVASGGSPWKFSNKTGLLAQGNSSLSTGTQVLASPPDPYIYLPQSACDAIAAELPVSYQARYGLYFWNTSDPQYSRIVTSPSYIGFTFQKNGVNDQNLTINVPFSLLNLTLDAPLISQPTPYFPCMGTNGTYALGRSFLQAAFIGFNWNGGMGDWFLAQAPGPGISQTPSLAMIDPNATTISGSSNNWAGTWSTHWTTLAPPASTPSGNSSVQPSPSPSPSPSSGLSTGAKAGIGVACAVAAILVIAAAIWLFSRRRRSRDHQAIGSAETTVTGSDTQKNFPLSEVASDPIDPTHRTVYELPSNNVSGLHEL